MATKTRIKSSCQLSLFLGVGKELVVSELPTARDILRYGLLQRELSEQDRRNINVNEIVDKMMSAMVQQWSRANAKFKAPVINHKDTLASHWP